MKFLDFQNGKKTYAVVVVGIGLGIAQHFGWAVPSWVEWGLTFLGLGTLRHAVQSQSAKSADDIAELVKLVLASVTIPDPNADTTGATVKTVPVETHVLPPLAARQ